MDTDETRSTAAHDLRPRLGGAFRQAARWLDRTAHDEPLACVAAAGAVGLVLGGLVFSRAARFAAVVAAGYVANELLHSEGRLGFLPWTDAFERFG